MKKVFLSLLAIAVFGLTAIKTSAQVKTSTQQTPITTLPLKIGVFDIDNFVQSTPEFNNTIKPKLQAYQKDSIGPQKDKLDTLITNAQNTYTSDSLAKKSPSILAYDRGQWQNLYTQEINWQQIAQNATQQKYAELAKPLYDKVEAAYKKALADNKVTLVLNPQVIEAGTDPKAIVNLFDVVADALGIKLVNAQDQQQ